MTQQATKTQIKELPAADYRFSPSFISEWQAISKDYNGSHQMLLFLFGECYYIFGDHAEKAGELLNTVVHSRPDALQKETALPGSEVGLRVVGEILTGRGYDVCTFLHIRQDDPPPDSSILAWGRWDCRTIYTTETKF